MQAGTSGAVVDVSFTTYAVETAHAQTFVRIDIVKTGSTIQAKTYRRERCKTGIKFIAISLKFSNLWKTSAPCRPIDSYRKKNHFFRWDMVKDHGVPRAGKFPRLKPEIVCREKKLLKKSRVETAEKLDRMISASSVLTVQKIIINQDLFAMNHLKESERRLFRNAQKDADLTRH